MKFGILLISAIFLGGCVTNPSSSETHAKREKLPWNFIPGQEYKWKSTTGDLVITMKVLSLSGDGTYKIEVYKTLKGIKRNTSTIDATNETLFYAITGSDIPPTNVIHWELNEKGDSWHMAYNDIYCSIVFHSSRPPSLIKAYGTAAIMEYHGISPGENTESATRSSK